MQGRNDAVTAAAATVSIATHRDLITGEWFVESVNLRFGDIRNTTSFAKPMLLSEAFAPEMYHFLEPHLPRTANPQVIALSDCEVEIGDLVLCGLRVMAQKVQGSIQMVIIRFRDVFGSLHHIFNSAHLGYLEHNQPDRLLQ